jgi:hypothetical protein
MSLEGLGLNLGFGQVVALLALLVGVASVGLRMSGYVNRRVGLATFWVAVAGIAGIILKWPWPPSQQQAAALVAV